MAQILHWVVVLLALIYEPLRNSQHSWLTALNLASRRFSGYSDVAAKDLSLAFCLATSFSVSVQFERHKHKLMKISKHLLLHSCNLHLILSVNFCVTKATTGAFILHPKDLRSQHHSGKLNQIRAGWPGSAQNGTV